MRCENCGIDLELHALSDKPDPGYGYSFHTWERCARQLLAEAAGLPVRQVGSGDLANRISRLLNKKDERWDRVDEAARILNHLAK